MMNSLSTLTDPRLEQTGALHLAGIIRSYQFETASGIPDQWQAFAPLIPQLTQDPQPVTYGVIHRATDSGFDYLTGIIVAADAELPHGVTRLPLAAAQYLVFWHPDHVATLRQTCDAIWSDWLPASDFEFSEAPWFERYGAWFDPQTGAGGVEVWIPVR